MTDPNLIFVFYSRQLVLGSFLRSVVCSPKNRPQLIVLVGSMVVSIENGRSQGSHLLHLKLNLGAICMDIVVSFILVLFSCLARVLIRMSCVQLTGQSMSPPPFSVDLFC